MENKKIRLDVEETQEKEPGFYPQEDGTVDVVLSEPLVRGSGDNEQEIWTVKINRSPSPKECDKAGGKAMLLNMYDSAHMAVLPSITEPQITSRIYNILDAGDQQSLITGVCFFLMPKRKRGQLAA